MLNLYQSDLHNCSYLPDQHAVTVFADPKADMNNALYEHLLEQGFRRSGKYVYTPKCPNCKACISIRILATDFSPSRNHKRTIRLNADIEINKVEAQYTQEHFELYQQYIAGRHEGGGMENPTAKDYMNFLTSSWSDTYFYELRSNGRLLAVMVVDELQHSLSAVYTFFDLTEQKRSLGHFAILHLLARAKQMRKPWVYLGYYIASCDKMNYKSRYRPLQALLRGKWRQFNPGDKL